MLESFCIGVCLGLIICGAVLGYLGAIPLAAATVVILAPAVGLLIIAEARRP